MKRQEKIINKICAVMHHAVLSVLDAFGGVFLFFYFPKKSRIFLDMRLIDIRLGNL